jgi:hypothetical protein
MAAVPVTLNGVLYPKGRHAGDKPVPAVFIGSAWITGLAPGGGPEFPPEWGPPVDPPPIDKPPPDIDGPPPMAVKPPPPGGGWGYAPNAGWGYFPAQGEPGPKRN